MTCSCDDLPLETKGIGSSLILEFLNKICNNWKALRFVHAAAMSTESLPFTRTTHLLLTTCTELSFQFMVFSNLVSIFRFWSIYMERIYRLFCQLLIAQRAARWLPTNAVSSRRKRKMAYLLCSGREQVCPCWAFWVLKESRATVNRSVLSAWVRQYSCKTFKSKNLFFQNFPCIFVWTDIVSWKEMLRVIKQHTHGIIHGSLQGQEICIPRLESI